MKLNFKPFKNIIIMKTILLVIAILIVNNSIAQKNPFIRIYDNYNNKFAKGKIRDVSDSSLFIIQAGSDSAVEIPFYKIGYIAKGRSSGHTILMATMASSLSLGALVYFTHNDSPPPTYDNQVDGFTNFINSAVANSFQTSASQDLAGGAIIGSVGGAIVGTIVSALVNHKVIIVKKELNGWGNVHQQLKGWMGK